MNILTIRLAFFFKNTIARPDQVFWPMSSAIPEFDLVPTMQPLPDGIQIDGVPVIFFNSNNRVFNCEIGHNRMDLIINASNRFKQFNNEALQKEFISIGDRIIKFISNQTVVDINRVGCVTEVFIETDKNVELVCQLTKSNATPNIKEFSVRINKDKNLSDLECNDIITFETGAMNIDGKIVKGVKGSHDINNIPNPEFTFTKEHLTQFVNDVRNACGIDSFEGILKCQTPLI